MDEKQKVLARPCGLHAVAFFYMQTLRDIVVRVLNGSSTSWLRLAGFYVIPRALQRTLLATKEAVCAQRLQ